MWVEILNKSFKQTVKIKKNQPLGFAVIKLEHLKFKYERSDSKKKKGHTQKRENEEAAKAENDTGNVAAFLTAMNLLMQLERWLIKPPRLPLVLSRLLQTISMLLQPTGSVRLSVRVVKKWREFFQKSYVELLRMCIRHRSDYWEILGNNNSIKLKEKYQINLLQIVNLFKYKLYTKNYFYYIPPPPPPASLYYLQKIIPQFLFSS